MIDRSDVISRLTAAIGTGEVIGICYHGGSQPGAYREIIPLQIFDDKVRVRCRTSGAAKTFSLGKIEIKTLPAAPDEQRTVWTAGTTTPATPLTMAEIEAAHRAGLEALGWHVVREGEGDDQFLFLFKRTKAGKLLKHPTVMLSFETTAYDHVAMPDGTTVLANPRPRGRPWGVRGRQGSCGTWSAAGKAVEVFLREAAIRP